MGINVSVESIDALIRSIMEQYDKRPEGWRILTDTKANTLVVGPNVGYRLKMIPINPEEYTGVGLKIISLEEVQNFVRDTPFYGFRPLQDREAKGLINALHQEGAVPTHLVQRILGIKPVSTSELSATKPKAILSGPVIAYPDLSTISKTQQELEMKLMTEADKLFRRRYPHRALIYG